MLLNMGSYSLGLRNLVEYMGSYSLGLRKPRKIHGILQLGAQKTSQNTWDPIAWGSENLVKYMASL